MTAVSTVYNTSFNITTDYNYSTYTPDVHNQSSSNFQGWNHLATGNAPGTLPNICYGLYKFYNSDHDFYFYLDWRDIHYTPFYPNGYNGSCIGHCDDLWIWYDGSTQNIYYSNDYGNTSELEINKGDYLAIWYLKGKGTPLTSDFQNFWSNCLSPIPKYNSENFLAPFIVWGPIPNFTATGYKIYRSIRPKGMPPGTYSLIATVSSSTYSYLDEDILVNGIQVAYYKVKAYNASTESGFTNTANISVSGFYKKSTSEDKRSKQSFVIHQNYPNPFNPTTEIRNSLPEPSQVKILVMNTLGQEVRTLVNARQGEGEHSVLFHASELPSGIYFYAVYAGDFTEIKKMIYLR